MHREGVSQYGSKVFFFLNLDQTYSRAGLLMMVVSRQLPTYLPTSRRSRQERQRATLRPARRDGREPRPDLLGLHRPRRRGRGAAPRRAHPDARLLLVGRLCQHVRLCTSSLHEAASPRPTDQLAWTLTADLDMRCRVHRREHQMYDARSRQTPRYYRDTSSINHPGPGANSSSCWAAIELGQGKDMWFVPFDNITRIMKVTRLTSRIDFFFPRRDGPEARH